MTKNDQKAVVVVGDPMIDVYFITTPRGLSAEAPIPVLTVHEDGCLFLEGGAGNVASNLSALGLKVGLAYRSDVSRPKKYRVMAEGVQVCRFDVDDQCAPVTTKDLDSIMKEVEPIALVISDYSKGAITEALVDAIKATGLELFVDTKASPADWPDEATFFPNLKEWTAFEHIYTHKPSVVLKKGAAGMSFMTNGQQKQLVPALAKKVVSVNGAGDTVMAAYVASVLGGGASPLTFAAVAAALAVETPFTTCPALEEVEKRATEEFENGRI